MVTPAVSGKACPRKSNSLDSLIGDPPANSNGVRDLCSSQPDGLTYRWTNSNNIRIYLGCFITKESYERFDLKKLSYVVKWVLDGVMSFLNTLGRLMSGNSPWSNDEAIAKLSHNKFGETLVQDVARKLIEDQDSGGLYQAHRDYCGHGLIFREGQFRLIQVTDGLPEWGDCLMTWDTLDEFVEFFSDQSDYSCSGADIDAKLFYTTNGFEVNNQRITEKWLQDYVSR